MLLLAADKIDKSYLQNEHKRVYNIKDDLRQKLENIYKKVGNKTAVMMLGMGGESRKDVSDAVYRLLGSKIKMEGKIIRHERSKHIAKQHKQKYADK